MSSDEKRMFVAPVIGASLCPPSMRSRTSDEVAVPSTCMYRVDPNSTAVGIRTPVPPPPADGSLSPEPRSRV